MYKVFLVDDEIVIREGIRNNVRWEACGFALCGEAPDSEIALSMVQELKPDILITDIRMPFMDGLELCRRVTRTMPWIHIVILSGHDDFSYAQEAISLGVKEYLLKPIAALDLEQVLARIAANIERERAQQADVDALKRQLESSGRLMREERVMNLLDGMGEEEAIQQASSLSMNRAAEHYIVMLVGLNEQCGLLRARGAVERIADGYDGAVQLCARAGQIAVLVAGDTSQDLEERAYAFAQAVQHELAREGAAVRVAIGAPVERLSALPVSLQAASKLLLRMTGRNRIMGTSDDAADAIDARTFQTSTVPLYDRLRYANTPEVPALVREYLDALSPAAVESMLMINYVVVDVLLTASRIVNQCGGEAALVIPETEHVATILTEIRDASDIRKIATDVLTRALSYRDDHAPGRHSATVRKACQYIAENYAKPDIMLREVADHVALSNNHFCTVFSQEMGLTFIEYLTQLRMDRAKEYLKTTDFSSGDVAERVGYNDPHYFRYLFKKHVGMNPRDYRASTQR